MQTINDVHHQFASFFKSEILQPYAWLVSKKLSEGHVCLLLDDIDNDIEYMPESLKNRISGIDQLRDEPLVSVKDGEKQPFILHNNRLYLQRYFNYESIILDRIEKFIEDEKRCTADRLASIKAHRFAINALFDAEANQTAKDTNQQPDWQMAAAISCVLNNFSIITGGPGTGKTTTVAKILAILFHINKDIKVALAAPTGKAAKRMGESLKASSFKVDEEIKPRLQQLQPGTIHRLLKSIPDSPYFRYNSDNPLEYDVVIVDESSMLDVALFAKLLDAIGPLTRLILLGDKDQLASVEAGSLFGDLCESPGELNRFSTERIKIINSFITGSARQIGPNQVAEHSGHPFFEHIIELKYSHRFKSDQGIGKFSKAIIENDTAAIAGFYNENTDRQIVLDPLYSQAVFEKFVEEFVDYIKEPDIKTALKKFNDLRILCAIREGEYGLYVTNHRVEKYLADKRYISLKGEFYEQRPVMMTSNNYSLGLFNGDIGLVRPDNKGVLKVWFETPEGEIKSILPGLIAQAETVYAMTIHKSQGSEFNTVLIILPDSENIQILTRELLYTGVTRAKHQALVQGKESSILQAASRQVKRASGLSASFKSSKDNYGA